MLVNKATCQADKPMLSVSHDIMHRNRGRFIVGWSISFYMYIYSSSLNRGLFSEHEPGNILNVRRKVSKDKSIQQIRVITHVDWHSIMIEVHVEIYGNNQSLQCVQEVVYTTIGSIGHGKERIYGTVKSFSRPQTDQNNEHSLGFIVLPNLKFLLSSSTQTIHWYTRRIWSKTNYSGIGLSLPALWKKTPITKDTSTPSWVWCIYHGFDCRQSPTPLIFVGKAAKEMLTECHGGIRMYFQSREVLFSCLDHL